MNEKGRSMVEMLGVLAIIAVLSAGALKGYSNAMFKYKMNQTIEIVNSALQKIIELKDKNFGEYTELYSIDDIVKYGILSECQKVKDMRENDACRLPMGNMQIGFDTSTPSGTLRGEVIIEFTSSKACVAFASVHWENTVPAEWFKQADDPSGGGAIMIENTSLYNLYNTSYDIITNATMDRITEACQVCNEEHGCYFYIIAHNEY